MGPIDKRLSVIVYLKKITTPFFELGRDFNIKNLSWGLYLFTLTLVGPPLSLG